MGGKQRKTIGKFSSFNRACMHTADRELIKLCKFNIFISSARVSLARRVNIFKCELQIFSTYATLCNNIDCNNNLLTFIMILGRHCQHSVLNVLILVNFSLVELLVKVGRVVVLVGDANSNEFRDC